MIIVKICVKLTILRYPTGELGVLLLPPLV